MDTWTVDKLIESFHLWDCHQTGECECPHRDCDTICSGKVSDHCQVEAASDSLEDANADIPGCHPDTCAQAQLEALLAIVRALLEIPGNRDIAEKTLQKHLNGKT